jgi:hypothetical protein
MSIAIPRSGWGARAPRHRYLIESLPAPEVWIHHEANAMPGDWQPKATEIAEMREIQAFHMKPVDQGGRGWSDIAYNFVIFDSGNVYEGRGWAVKGGHTENHNSTSHGICFAGNFQIERPILAALDACRQLIAEGKAKGYVLNRRQPTGGHRDTKPTACPGDNLYAKLDYLRVPWKEDDMTEAEVKAIIGKVLERHRVVQFAAGIFDKAADNADLEHVRAKGQKFAEEAVAPGAGGIGRDEYDKHMHGTSPTSPPIK